MFSLPFLHSSQKGILPVPLKAHSSRLLLVKYRAAYKGFLGNSPARQPCIASSVFFFYVERTEAEKLKCLVHDLAADEG